MENPQLNNLILNSISMTAKDVLNDIFLLPKARRGFAYNHTTITVPIYFYRLIGVNNEDEDEYYNSLFNLDNQLSKLKELYKRIDNRLDTAIPQEKINKVNWGWGQVEDIKSLNLKLIVENLFRAGVLPSTRNQIKDKLIKEKFLRTLDIFIGTQKNINSSILKNFSIKILHWIEKYGLLSIKSFDYTKHNPKVMFYGDIKRDEIYFLIFLSLIGFDILYIHTCLDDVNEIDREGKFSHKLEFSRKMPIKPFPMTEKLKRVETIGYRASKELESVISREESWSFKPWQFENYSVKSSPLKTTYEELFEIWKEEARFRTGFEVKEGTVYVPNIFAKINGTSTNLSLYWANISKLLKESRDNVMMVDQIPFTNPAGRLISWRDLLDNEGLFDRQKVLKSKEYNLSYLRTSVQNLVIDKVNELVVSDNIFLSDKGPDYKAKILSTVLNMDKKYYNLMQKFDYAFRIPKLIIYDNNEKVFSEEDFIALAFLHCAGWDILVLTPPGYNNIENGISKERFDVHYLDELRFDLQLIKEIKSEIQKHNKKGLINRLFSK